MLSENTLDLDTNPAPLTITSTSSNIQTNRPGGLLSTNEITQSNPISTTPLVDIPQFFTTSRRPSSTIPTNPLTQSKIETTTPCIDPFAED